MRLQAGISTASLFRRAATEDCFDVFRRLGVTVTEAFLGTYSEYDPAFAKLLAARKGEIAVHSVHSLSTQFEPQLFSEETRVRDDAERYFRMVCAAGEILGAKYYTFHGPVRLKKRAYRYDYARLAAVLRRLDGIAGEYGVCTAYENVHWAYGAAPEFFAALRTEYPQMRCTLDCKQAVQAGYDPPEFIDAMGESIVTVHVCDVDAAAKTALPGRGGIDFARVFRRLRDVGGDAAVLLEVYDTDYEREDELGDALAYIEQCLRAAAS